MTDGGVATLIQLRLRLFVRRSLTAYTRKSRVVAPLKLVGMVVVATAVLAGFIAGLSLLLRLIVSGPHGRTLLAPILTWGLTVTTLFIFFYAVLAVLAVFTYTSDLELLLLTPLSPKLILGDKLLTVSGGFFVLLLVVGMPVLLALGHTLHLGPDYDYATVLVLFMVPIAPVSLALIVTLAILRWLPPERARAVTAVLGVLLLVGFYLAGQLLRGHASSFPPSLGNLSGWWSFVPLTWPGHALAAVGLGQTASALVYFQALGALDAVLAWLALYLSAQMFSVGWAGYQEVGRRSRPGPSQALSGARGAHLPRPGRTRRRSIGHAYFPLLVKEWLTLRRDPRILGQAAVPLVLALFTLAHMIYGRGALVVSVAGATHGTVGWFCATLSFTALFLVSFLALSVVNREGTSLYLLALAPLRPRTIVVAKWAFSSAPALIVTELLLLVGATQLKFTVFETVAATISVGILVIALSGSYLLLGLVWPRISRDGASQPVSPLGCLSGGVGGLSLSIIWSVIIIAGFALLGNVPWAGTVLLAMAIAITCSVCALVSAVAPGLLTGLFVSDMRAR